MSDESNRSFSCSIERRIIVNYRWSHKGHSEIPSEHISQLEEDAETRISEMMAQGYLSGELNTVVQNIDGTDTGEREYNGWWSVTKD